jgi:hypothetical protein
MPYVVVSAKGVIGCGDTVFNKTGTSHATLKFIMEQTFYDGFVDIVLVSTKADGEKKPCSCTGRW